MPLVQINQNLYFDCFEILFLFPIIVLGISSSSLLLFWNIIFFPFIVLGYYFLLYYCFGILFYFILYPIMYRV